MSPKKQVTLATALYLLLFFLFPTQAIAELVLGVHPYVAPETIRKRFQPLTDFLSAKLATPVKLQVGNDYQSHIDTIGKDQIDIAYLGPASYVTMVKLHGKKPILARLENKGKSTFNGFIVVREDSGITALSQLRGKRFAFGDINSTMSSLVPMAMLKQHGISHQELASAKHYKGHKNVAMAVLSGDADAGAVKEGVYRIFSNRGLKTLTKSPDISEHLFVASNTLPPELVNRLRKILLSIQTPLLVQPLLHPIKPGLTGLNPGYDSQYDNLRQLMNSLEESSLSE